jgi:hypothetical protein
MKIFELNGQSNGQSAGGESDALRQVVIAEMRAESPILEDIEFYTMIGSADTPRKNATALGGANRAINAAWGANTTAPAFGAVALKILGDQVQTDRAYERRGGDIGSERLRELKAFSRSLARYFTDQVFNGALDATHFSGLYELVDASMIFNLNGDANGSSVTLGNSDAARASQQKFLEAIDVLIQETGATVLAMPTKVRSRLITLGRDFVTVSNVTDAIGNPVQLLTYNGVKVVVPGYKKDKASGPILTSTEVLGTSGAACSSVWALRPGEKVDLTYATNVGVEVADRGLQGNLYTTDVEFDADSELLDIKALGRLRGVIIA